MLSFLINGLSIKANVDPGTPLLKVIHDYVGSTCIKSSCGLAGCGECTVRVDGRVVKSCSLPASAAAGREITTIEVASAKSSLDFSAIILPHLDAAYNLARWLLRSAPEAEDVVHEAMLRALTYFPSFRGTNARAWLLQIVRNAVYASLKQSKNTRFTPITDENNGDSDQEWIIEALTDPADDPEVTLGKLQEEKQLEALLGELPVELRECIILRELEDYSYKEIAEVTEMPIGTVMSRLWRARRLLSKLASRGET